MRPPWLSLLLFFLFQVCFCICQDLLISVGSRIQLHSVGNTTATTDPYLVFEPDAAATIETVTTVDSGVFYSSVTSDQTAIYYVPFANKSLDISARQLLLSPRDYSIEGLCYVQKESALFWTESKTKAIHKGVITGGSLKNITTFLELGSEDLLRSLVYDECTSRLFWTNWNFENPSIESVFVNGSGRRDIVRQSLYQPHGLAIFGNRLYFTNSKPVEEYDIESVSLDGTNRIVHLRGHDQYPIQLAVTSKHIYWTDARSQSVYYIPNNAMSSETPKLLYHGGSKLPKGVVIIPPELGDCTLATSEEPLLPKEEIMVVTESTDLDCSMYCVHGTCKVLRGHVKYCECQLGYTGLRCEQEICPTGYCLNKGTCQVNNDQPFCLCPPGFTGTKCEVNLCHKHCLNGYCTFQQNKPTCSCTSGFTGDRCEKDLCTDYCLNGGECQKNGANRKCICPGAYTGERCERSVCDKNCLNGLCTVANRTAVCRCDKGWGGSRCEKPVLDSEAICRSYCFNQGSCILTEDGGPICSCTEGFGGLRCEVSLDLLRGEQQLLIPLVSCSVLSFVLILVAAFLGVQVWRLHKRPRIRKHFIVNKPSAQPPSDGIQLELENCCNMNVCDTPCFEPKTRPSNTRFSKKEEKYNLLKNANDLF